MTADGIRTGIDPRLYRAWCGMRDRCRSKRKKFYSSYGAQGITVDPRWDDFLVFAADMGPHPGKGWTLDRKKNDRGYRRSNCRWANRKTQGRNRRMVLLTLKKADEIRRRYATGLWSTRRLAPVFGVSQSTICAILHKRIWT